MDDGGHERDLDNIARTRCGFHRRRQDGDTDADAGSEALRERILVDNPAKLYGFDT